MLAREQRVQSLQAAAEQCRWRSLTDAAAAAAAHEEDAGSGECGDDNALAQSAPTVDGGGAPGASLTPAEVPAMIRRLVAEYVFCRCNRAIFPSLSVSVSVSVSVLSLIHI